MKIKTTATSALLSLCIFAPIMAYASSFESAVNEAVIEINKAKAVNYEWRDSRKILKKAEKLYQKGDKHGAMKLVAKAKKQGQLAVAQAKAQSRINGPHQ